MAELTLNNLKIDNSAKKSRKRRGRGNASGHGTYSGRGFKGQKARSGGKKGLKRRGLANILKSKPKLSGFTSHYAKPATVNLDGLQRSFENGEVVNAKKLIGKNLIKDNRRGVKILGDGKLTKKLTVFADSFSQTAKEAIIKAGGQAELLGQTQKPSQVKK